MRAVNRFNVTHFWNPHVLRIPNWYGTCLVMKIFTIGLPAECAKIQQIHPCRVYISHKFPHSALWQEIIHYSGRHRDNELPDPDSGLGNFHENTSPFQNVSLSHCTNILYSLEFYTSSQPTMSTSTRTRNTTTRFWDLGTYPTIFSAEGL